MTEQEKKQALNNAIKSLNTRIDADANIRRNSFEEWGNDKCIRRTRATIQDMRNGTASDRQYAYWLKN